MSKVTYSMICWMMNVDNMKQCDTRKTNSTCAGTKPTKIVPITTFPDAQATFAVRV